MWTLLSSPVLSLNLSPAESLMKSISPVISDKVTSYMGSCTRKSCVFQKKYMHPYGFRPHVVVTSSPLVTGGME